MIFTPAHALFVDFSVIRQQVAENQTQKWSQTEIYHARDSNAVNR